MEKHTLYKFFAGEATEAEKCQIKAWMEEDETHRQILQEERASFDALLLTDDETWERASVCPDDEIGTGRRRLRRLTFFVARWAAVFLLAFMGGYVWLEHRVPAATSGLNTVTVPRGQRTELTLADGTRVCLNAGSTLTYPTGFGHDHRQVALDGEAYFEVSHDADRPFVVHTQVCDVEVLGTKFNVEAYSEENTFSAALMEGRVKVDNNYRPSEVVYLEPHQQVRLKHGALDVSRIDNYDVYRWREGLICFSNKNFVELMTQIEKYYGVQLVVENRDLASHAFSGKFRVADGVDYLLRVLRKDVRFGYTYSENRDTIYIH